MDPARLSDPLREHSESFTSIYGLVTSSSGKTEFLFNALVQYELGEKYQNEFNNHVLPFAKKVPIPLSRLDGLYPYDGSILHGGKMGGSLNEFLKADGYPQEENIIRSAAELGGNEKLFEKSPRKREFDVEHMESALEAEAGLFLTNDERTILKRLRNLSESYKPSHAINAIHSIARTPTAALLYVRGQLNT
jgi:hypothetical protein